MSRLRIFYYINALEWGGAEKYILEVANNYKAMGTQIAIMLHEDCIESYAKLISTFTVGEILPYNEQRSWLGYLREGSGDKHWTILHLNIPHINAYHYGFTAMKAKLLGVNAIVGTVHLVSSWSSFRRRLVAKPFHGFLDGIVAVSEAVRQGLIEQHGFPEKKVTTIRNGIHPLLSASPMEIEEVKKRVGFDPSLAYFGIIGRLSPQKGHARLIAAAKIMRKQTDRFCILVLGNGELRAELTKQVGEAGLEDYFQFLGHVSNVQAYLKLFRAVVFTSNNEGFPYTAVECFAAGVPVLAFAIPSMRETLMDGRCGYLVQPFDCHGLATTMTSLADGSTVPDRKVAEARDFYDRELRHEVMMQKTSAWIQSIVQPERDHGCHPGSSHG